MNCYLQVYKRYLQVLTLHVCKMSVAFNWGNEIRIKHLHYPDVSQPMQRQFFC